jgi:outer membrane protein assembly factor BamB
VDSLGLGHSSAAVTNDAIYLTAMPDSTGGVLYALDLDGKMIWQDKYGVDWNTNFTGTRSTPTVTGDHLYFISGFGEIYCYDIRKKEKVWTLSFLEDFKVEPLKYGISESPLIDGQWFYCTPGGKENNVVCLNRITGEVIWTSKGMEEETSYPSSILIEHNGNKMLICVTKESIFALDHRNGGLL